MIQFSRTPYRVLSVAAFTGILCIIASTWISTHQPWLGLAFQDQNDLPGAFVARVEKNSPAAQILSPGDNILSLQAVAGTPVEIQASDLVEDPDIFPTFREYNTFKAHQGTLAAILREPVVKLNLEDGRKVRVQPAPSRPLSSLPLQFWLLNAMGIIIFMIGSGVLSAQPGSITSRVFFGSGLGLLLTTTSVAVMVSREIAFDPELLLRLRLIYHTGNSIFTAFGISLLYHYPTLLSSFPLSRLSALLISFFWLNERFEWMDFPGHTTFIQPVIYFAIGAAIGFLQWRKSRGHPVDRAALKWFLLSFLGLVGFAMFIYFVLGIIHGHTVVPISAGLGAVMFMYIGLALGIVRYRLFDIDRWWFAIWFWFFAGVSILAVDGLLAFTLTLKPSISLAVSLVLVGWFYFPIRQWVWGRVYRKSQSSLELYLPALVAGIVDQGRGGETVWEDILKEVFKPLSFKRKEGTIPTSELEKHGEIMLIPAFSGNGTIELRYADNGNRLFSPADIRMATEIHKIAHQTEDQLAAYNRGVGEERERIMRDLHDDIGGRLLSLIHATKGKKEIRLARDALRALRDIIYSIDPATSMTVGEALATWRHDLYQRCKTAEVTLHWENISFVDSKLLTPRQLVNISRVLYEAASNAFAHARPEHIWVEWDIEDHQLVGFIRNDGLRPENGELHYGKGIKNMERRIADLGGQCTHRILPDDGVFQVRLTVPISDEL